MKKINIKLKIILAMAAISTITALAWAVEFHKKDHLQPVKKQAGVAGKQEHTYDPELLARFEKIGTQMDFNKQHCTYSGVINVDDGSDTTLTVHGIEFLFCRSGKDFYYRMGNTETIHENGLNIFIQQEQHRVVLSAQDLVVKPPVTDLHAIEKSLRYEDYDLVCNASGGLKTLSVLNGHHVTCKELSFTYDTLSGKLEKIYTRFSNLADPLNKTLDRVVDISVRSIEDKDHLEQYTSSKDVLEKRGGKWRLKSRYATYELITL